MLDISAIETLTPASNTSKYSALIPYNDTDKDAKSTLREL